MKEQTATTQSPDSSCPQSDDFSFEDMIGDGDWQHLVPTGQLTRDKTDDSFEICDDVQGASVFGSEDDDYKTDDSFEICDDAEWARVFGSDDSFEICDGQLERRRAALSKLLREENEAYQQEMKDRVDRRRAALSKLLREEEEAYKQEMKDNFETNNESVFGSKDIDSWPNENETGDAILKELSGMATMDLRKMHFPKLYA